MLELGLNGRTALVLGASSGLGLASAEALAEEGANVVMFARRVTELHTQADRLRGTPVVGDVLARADLERALRAAIETYGGLDVLVLNGGGPPPGEAAAVSADAIAAAVDLLLVSVVTVTSLALPHLCRSGHGRIISIGSVSAHEPIDGLALSNAVRPGVWGYLKTLSREVAKDGITVNSVAPGRIDTARTRALYGATPPQEELDPIPSGRFGSPRELGDVVCFLASRRASYVNGALIPIDGGLSRSL